MKIKSGTGAGRRAVSFALCSLPEKNDLVGFFNVLKQQSQESKCEVKIGREVGL